MACCSILLALNYLCPSRTCFAATPALGAFLRVPFHNPKTRSFGVKVWLDSWAFYQRVGCRDGAQNSSGSLVLSIDARRLVANETCRCERDRSLELASSSVSACDCSSFLICYCSQASVRSEARRDFYLYANAWWKGFSSTSKVLSKRCFYERGHRGSSKATKFPKHEAPPVGSMRSNTAVVVVVVDEWRRWKCFGLKPSGVQTCGARAKRICD